MKENQIWKMTTYLVTAVVVSLVGACSSSKNTYDADALKVVQALATGSALPGLADLALKTDSLRTSCQAFTAMSQAQSLDDCQLAWINARAAWMKNQVFLFGPGDDARLIDAIDWSPVDTVEIESEVSGSNELNAAYVDALGANKKGFHALEYFIFAGAAGDNSVLLKLGEVGAGDRRKAYVNALCDSVLTHVNDLKKAWSTDGGNYATQWSQPGSPASPYPKSKNAIDVLVNYVVLVSEAVVRHLGEPLGTKAGGAIQPSEEESALSDNSLGDLSERVAGMRAVYEGVVTDVGQEGIATLITARSAELDMRTRAAFDDTTQKLDALKPSFHQALVDRTADVQAAYDSAKNLRTVLKTEVASILGVTVTFSDSDSD